jgi:hypothetical protein
LDETLIENGGINKYDNFLIIWDDSNNIIDDTTEDLTLVEFDYWDGRLYVKPKYMEILKSFVPLESEEIKSYLKKWFEKKFKVDVKYVHN